MLDLVARLKRGCRRAGAGYEQACRGLVAGLGRCLRDRRGQGTTEYAILVGVIVVIAIIAIVAFRQKLVDLWEAISSAMASL